MVRRLSVALAFAMAVQMAGAAAGTRPEPVRVFSGGATASLNGFFFPGTAQYRDGELEGVPLAVERGQDVLLTNLDEDTVSKCHQLRSLKSKRGRPLFYSKMLCDPGAEAKVRTSRLKPGTYGFMCTVHANMFGLIEVAERSR